MARHVTKEEIGKLYQLESSEKMLNLCQPVEIETEGGFGQHISPFTDLRDVGSLLQRAGLNLTTLDSDDIVIDYPSMFELMEDLKGMGENNSTWHRKTVLNRETMLAASAIYREMYGNDDGSIPATFRVLYLIGWKKSKDQPKAMERGSATANLLDL